MVRKFLFVLIILAVRHTISYSQDWTVPEDKTGKVASFKFDDVSHKNGEKIFLQNCISCHGTPGKNNFVHLVPPPGDPATDKFQKQTDGDLFYKITTGRGAMPSFKNTLTEEERWSVISYLRSFNSNYIQPQPVVVPVGKFGGMDIMVNITFDSLKNQFKTIVKGIKEKDTTAVAGLEVSLFAKRYFGQLQIDESKTTNNEGEAVFTYNKILPGDTAGNIILYAQINAEGLSDLKNEKTLKAGSLMTAKSLISTRAMWTIASQAPVWLILAYCMVVIGVWSFLIYIILQIRKISKLGKQ